MSYSKGILLGLGIALLIGCSAADAATVRKGHPRIFITRESIPALKERVQTTHASSWRMVKETADWSWRRKINVNDWGTCFNWRVVAFAYLLTGDERYLKGVKRHLRAYAANIVKDQFLTVEVVWSMALAYDWCYDHLTDDERRMAARALLEMNRFLDTIWRFNDFCNHFVLEKVSAPLFVGLALYGDGIADEEAAAIVAKCERLLKEHALAAANFEEGAHCEGFSYSAWGWTRPLCFALEAWRTATGEDLFRDSAYFKNHAKWVLMCRRPHDGCMVRTEDCPSNYRWGGNERIAMLLIASRLGDGYAQWIVNQIPIRYGIQALYDILWRDPTVKPKPPNTLPLAWLNVPLGYAVMRSDWGEDATFAFFQCGPRLAGHQHFDNNSFVIHKMGSLAIDSGANDYGSHGRNYYWRTIAHNTITVYMPNERWLGRSDVSNDGGQSVFVRSKHGSEANPTYVHEVKPNSGWDIGKIIAYETNEHYTYVAGDATRSYDERKLRQFVRQFLYLRPDTFVVFDRVESTRADYTKRWLLHSINEPAIEGDTIVITHKRGKLIVKCLLPKRRKIVKIGGAGHEFEVEGRNYPPSPRKLRESPEAGAWRIEVVPAEPSQRDVFLHVLHATSIDDPRTLQVQLLNVGNVVRLRIRIGRRAHTVSFNAVGRVGGHVKIESDGKVIVDADLTTSIRR